MKCEHCNQKESSFFYEETVNGKHRTIHLCNDCAVALGLSSISTSLPFYGISNNLFDGFFGFAPQTVQKNNKICEGCGSTLGELRANKKAFCPKCYHTFSAELEPTIRSLHGSAVHKGRRPARVAAAKSEDDRLGQLREQLADAIKEENFEAAATIRDEIRALEQK